MLRCNCAPDDVCGYCRAEELREQIDALRAEGDQLRVALKAADYRLSEVSNYLGPFDHKMMFGLLTETIQQVREALKGKKPT